MEKSIILLNKELYEWKEHYESEKIYYKGNELQGSKSFAECVENISDLQQAIDTLEKQKANVISSNAVLNEVGGAVKKEITFHLNHYVDDARIYEPIIEKLLTEGWQMDNERCREEKIGNFIFRHRWLIRVFQKSKLICANLKCKRPAICGDYCGFHCNCRA